MKASDPAPLNDSAKTGPTPAAARLTVDLAEDIVVTCEAALLGLPKRSQETGRRLMYMVWSTLAGPMSLVSQGLSQTRGQAWALVLGLTILGLLFNAHLSAFFSSGVTRQINVLWALLSVLTLLLPNPSAAGFRAYSSSTLQRAYRQLGELTCMRKDAIDVYQRLTDRAESKALRRLSTLKHAVGIGWALAVYLGQQGFEARDSNLLGMAFTPLMLTAFALALITNYGLGVSAVFSLAKALLAQRELDLAHGAMVFPTASPPFEPRLRRLKVPRRWKRQSHARAGGRIVGH
jgi:hypothetical protein